MEFIIKKKNKIEYQTRKKLLKGQFIVKSISIGITSGDPNDLYILKMHKGLIEKTIIQELNKGLYIKQFRTLLTIGGINMNKKINMLLEYKKMLLADDSLYIETKNKINSWIGCASFLTNGEDKIKVFVKEFYNIITKW